MSSDKNEAQTLPDGWILCQSKSNPGRKYYFNKKTGKSSWTEPQVDEKSSKRELCKQKGKKDKKPLQEKRKEELQKKNLKRKSSGSESSPLKKKQKPVVLTSPEKVNHELDKKPSPVKQIVESPTKYVEQVAKVETPIKPIKPAPSKNLANTRLSLLREQLNAEVQALKQAETEKSPQKNKLRISPNTGQTEPPAKLPRLDLKSPNLNETKCSNALSPSSDSIQSIPSPSQFFAANKIISSMKAQLPEEYSNKIKPIDTFAAIEEGICSQITEYPFMKHPATPPQFSEASKLLSAIKSKLMTKVSFKEFNVQTYTSAKERMENLRSRLSSDTSDKERMENLTSRLSSDTSAKDRMENLRSRLSSDSSAKERMENLRSRLINDTSAKERMDNLRSRLSSDSSAKERMENMRSRLSSDTSAKERMENLRSRLSNDTSAKERMENLRSRISSETENEVCKEITDEEYLSRIELPPSEAMEVEDCKEMIQNVPSFQCTKDNVDDKENVVLVVDTNIFIHELDVIKNVLNSHIKGYTEQPNLLVPWRVINELDRLKDNNNGNGAICKRARAAMDYLYKSLPEDNRIKGQSLRDANSHIYPCESPDDEILNCCLQQAERGKSVILLSNDKNLCSKAAINSIRCIGLDSLKPLLEAKSQPSPDPDRLATVKHLQNTMYQLLANILENEIRAKYNNLWQHVIFKAPPWTFTDVVQCLLKHWIAVFNEVFPRIEHLIIDLKNTVISIEKKDPESLSQSEVLNFKELCLEIAKKCQIIPEYMELAKTTVERLTRRGSEGDGARGKEMAVIDAFEAMWTVFSSYCAKLCTAVNVPHSLEDKLPSTDSLADLTSKWPLFNSQLRELAHAMNGLLSTEPTDPAMSEHVTHLEIVFKESLAIISFDTSVIDHHSMRVFATNCRNMLQEAYTKFSELVELLDVCRNNIANQ